MTTFLEDESSSEASEPREIYVIALSTGVTYYMTSASGDIRHDGQIYSAIALARTQIGVNASGNAKELELSLPLDHPFCRRWTQQAVPPRRVTVTVSRMQSGGEVEQIWLGEITSMSWEGLVAKFRVPSRMSEILLRVLPNVSAGRTCPHMLYDGNCGVSRTGSSPGGLAYKRTANVIYVDGRTIRVDLGSTDRNGTWAEGGEVVHGSGERMGIRLQSDLSPGVSSVANIDMAAQIIGLAVGNSVDIYRGCDHTITACKNDFGNTAHFGGYPDLPTANPYLVGAIG